MRLYSLDKRNFLLVFLAFFACFALGIFIGLAGYTSIMAKGELKRDILYFRPEITLTREIDASTLSNSSQEEFLANGPFIIQTRLLGSYSRQFWLFAKYQIENTESKLRPNTAVEPFNTLNIFLKTFQMKFSTQRFR